jgi:hypothetical protein
LFEPPVSLDPPTPAEPPAPPEPPVPVDTPVPCKVVTLDASRVRESEPFEADTLPSLARLLLEEVVYFV